MAEKKSYMPQSTAGLLRYDEGDEKGIRIKPEYIVATGVLFAIAIKMLTLLNVF